MKLKNIVVKVLIVLALVAVFTVPVLAKGENPQAEIPPVTAESVTLLLIGGLSLLLDYAPGLAKKWDALSESTKKLVFLGAAVVIVIGAFILKCNGVIQTDIVCSEVGAWHLVTDVLYTFAIGTGIHIGTKPTTEMRNKMFGG
jgi:hypothetical protein